MAPCRPGSPHPPASIPLHTPLQRREPPCDQTAGDAAELGASNTTAVSLRLSRSRRVKHAVPDGSLHLWLYQAGSFALLLITAESKAKRSFFRISREQEGLRSSSASAVGFLPRCVFWSASNDAEGT